MNNFYVKVVNWTKAHPSFNFIMNGINIIISCICVISYPLLLVYLFVQRSENLASAILIPLDGFIILTVFRYLVNRKRPYEKYGFEPAIKKETVGKSFPSRHVFSATIIALTFLFASPFWWIGAVLMVFALLLAVIRVLTGVHYISDVLVGMLFAGICEMIGLFVFCGLR